MMAPTHSKWVKIHGKMVLVDVYPTMVAEGANIPEPWYKGKHDHVRLNDGCKSTITYGYAREIK